jgi:hypothetical protein
MKSIEVCRANSSAGHRLLTLSLTVFLGIASIAAAMASMTIESGPARDSAEDSASEAVIRRYYDAVNHMLATGDAVELRNVVSARMLDAEAPSPGWEGRDGLERHIAFVRAAVPGTWLEPVEVFAQNSTFIVRVAIRAEAAGVMLGFRLDEEVSLWARTEELGVANDQVIERRVDWNDLIRVEEAEEFSVAPDGGQVGSLIVGIDTFAPGGQITFSAAGTPSIVRVLSGELSPFQPASGQESLADLSSFGVPPPAGDAAWIGPTAGLMPADVRVVPPGSVAGLANHDDSGAASALRVAIRPPWGAAAHQPDQALSSVATEVLTSITGDELRGGATVSFGEAHLIPGSRLVVDSATTAIVVCTTAGTLRCVTPIHGGERGGLVRVDLYTDSDAVASPMLILARDGERIALLNAGPLPSTVWVLAIRLGAGQ